MEDGVNGVRGNPTIDHVVQPNLYVNESVIIQYQNIEGDCVLPQSLFK